jgi:hypothetical protein
VIAVVDWPAVIQATGTFVAALGAAIAAVVTVTISRQTSAAKEKSMEAADHAERARVMAEESKQEIIATRDGVFEVGKQLDGRLSELLKVTKENALAQGRVEGRAAEKEEGRAKPKEV